MHWSITRGSCFLLAFEFAHILSSAPAFLSRFSCHLPASMWNAFHLTPKSVSPLQNNLKRYKPLCVVRFSSSLPALSNDFPEQAALANRLSGTSRGPAVKSKLRQHVNPLQSRYQVPVQLLDDWVQAFFPEPHHPFVIDVGTGKGNWALNYGIANPGVNILGLEIRGSAVELARDRAQRLKVTNVAYLACNANVDIGRILQNISTVSRVSLVAIQFPDPHFKKRQKKRRLVNPSFVATLARGLTPGSEVFFQSDVEELILDANYVFSQCIDFLPNPTFDFSDFGRNQNPLKIMTDREISVVHRGEPVYRMSYLRCRN